MFLYKIWSAYANNRLLVNLLLAFSTIMNTIGGIKYLYKYHILWMGITYILISYLTFFVLTVRLFYENWELSRENHVD